MVSAVRGKRFSVSLLMIAPVLLLAACDENRPFSRSRIGSAATKLAVPTTMTPPVRVGRIQGAPANWKMRERVAEALRDRDIPADINIKGDTVYVLRGRIVKATAGGRARQVNVVWALFTPAGKRVGQATQFASLPDRTNDDVIEAVADSAAESIAPIVPSTRLAYADSVTSGEATAKTRTAYETKNPQTAIGRMGLKKSGIARNLKAHADARPGASAAGTAAGGAGGATRASVEAKTTAGALKTRSTVMSRRLAGDPAAATRGGTKAERKSAIARTGGAATSTGAATASAASATSTKATSTTATSSTALGRLGAGTSALSRNLARGVAGRARPVKAAAATARKAVTLSTEWASPGDVRKPVVKKKTATSRPGVRVLTEFYLPRRTVRRTDRRTVRRPVRRPATRTKPVAPVRTRPDLKKPARDIPIAKAPTTSVQTARAIRDQAFLRQRLAALAD